MLAEPAVPTPPWIWAASSVMTADTEEEKDGASGSSAEAGATEKEEEKVCSAETPAEIETADNTAKNNEEKNADKKVSSNK